MWSTWHYKTPSSARIVDSSLCIPPGWNGPPSMFRCRCVICPSVSACSSESCPASRFAYGVMVKNGYTNVRRYAGGISDWEQANYPMEGELV